MDGAAASPLHVSTKRFASISNDEKEEPSLTQVSQEQANARFLKRPTAFCSASLCSAASTVNSILRVGSKG